MRGTAADGTRNFGAGQLAFAAAAAANGRVMPSNTDLVATMHRWIERKPLTEAVSWTPKEKFWLLLGAIHYGFNDWKSIAQLVRNGGEPYRPREWYTSKSCERQFKIITTNVSKELKLLPFIDMLKHLVEVFKIDYIRDTEKANESLKNKYLQLTNIVKRVRQGNLSRAEVVGLYSQARRFETDGKQYMEQLMARQIASLTSGNSGSGLLEEPIKWNTPSAPLLTSLLKSRNTIPLTRTITTINSLLQTPGSTSRTRSGKLLPLSSSVRITQGTPTLSKLLEAPANPYLPSSPQSTHKNKSGDLIVTEKFVGNTSRKENTESRVRDTLSTHGSFNQTNKFDLSLKRQTSKSPISGIKHGSKANLNVVNLLSDSENEESNKNYVHSIQPRNLFGDKDISNCRIEPRATRSQTRAEGGFKQLIDNKLSGGKKEREILRQQSEESEITENHSIDDLIDLDQIDVEPLSLIPDDIITQIPPKITRSSMQRLRLNSSVENVLLSKVNSKEINNQMLEEISANFVLNSTVKNVATEYKNVMVGQSRIDNSNISGCLIPVDGKTIKDTILLHKDSQSFSNPVNALTTFDGKLLRQKRIIELKGANLRCIDGRTDKKIISFTNQPIVVVNKIKKPFNIKLSSETKDKTDNIHGINSDTNKSIKLHNNSQNLVKLLDGHSYSDEVIIIDDDVNADDRTLSKTNELSKSETKNCAVSTNNNSNNSSSSKSIGDLVTEKIIKNDKNTWNMFPKIQNPIDISLKNSSNSDVSKISNTNETNNRFIKELDFDFDQSITQSSLTELYNGVEEIVEMHSFDNEELNSLIDCSSLNNSVTEECQNTISLDQNDSSVSESDSTIGAFDTFAQITRVPQKSSTKSLYRETKIAIQSDKELKHDEGLIQSDEIDDDKAFATSVTGLPILQGVISDVMSKIDSDRVSALESSNKVDTENLLTNDDIVEISSDEEETMNNENLFSSNTEGLKIKKVNESNGIQEKAMKITNIHDDCETGIKKKVGDNVLKGIHDDAIIDLEIINDVCHPYSMIKKSVVKNIECPQSINDVIIIQESEEGNIEDISMPDKSRIEIELKTTEEKLCGEKELTITNDPEKNLLLTTKNLMKESDEKLIDHLQINEAENKAFEAEIMKRVKKTKIKNKIGAEIMLRVNRKSDIKKLNLSDLSKKESEIRKLKETEVRKAKDAELLEISREVEREAEVRLKEAEKCAKETEIQRAKEAEAAEIKILKELEIQRAKEAEIQRAKDTEMQKAKESEIQRVKEAEIQRAKEMEIRVAKESEIRKVKEVEMRKAEEVELQRLKEEEVRKFKETELIKVKEVEAIQTKKAEITQVKEAQFKKVKEIDIKQLYVNLKEAEIKTTKVMETKDSGIKKAKETEIIDVKDIGNINRCDNENSLQENNILTLEDHLEKPNKLEQTTLQTNKMNVKVIQSNDMKAEKDLEIKKNELTETKPLNIKTSTRTRAFKMDEENFIESNIEPKNVSVKSGLSIKSIASTSCLNLGEVNEDNIQQKVIGKSRTRSSMSFKQDKTLENKSTSLHKSKEQNELSTVTVSHEIQTTSCNKNNVIIPRNESSIHMVPEGETVKQPLAIAVVLLNADEVPNLIEKGYYHLSESSNSITSVGIKTEHNTPNPLNPISDGMENPKMPIPKKRGRKRRSVVQYEQLPKSNSNEPAFQNGETIIAKKSSTDEIVAKRTRRNVESYEAKKEQIYNDKRKSRKLRKNVLKLIYNNLCENNKYLSSLEKQVKDIPSDHIIIKKPIELKDIKRKITSGEISKISDLQTELMLMTYNAVMINKSNSIVFDDATNFQEELKDNFQLFESAMVESSDEEEDNDDLNSFDISSDDETNSMKFLISDNSEEDNLFYEEYNYDIPFMINPLKDKLLEKFDLLLENSFNSECPSPPLKMKKYVSSDNSSGSNNDSYDSNSDSDSNSN